MDCVVFVLWGVFQCPYCHNVHRTRQEIMPPLPRGHHCHCCDHCLASIQMGAPSHLPLTAKYDCPAPPALLLWHFTLYRACKCFCLQNVITSFDLSLTFYSLALGVSLFVFQPVSYQLWSDRKDRFALICSFVDIYVDIWKGITSLWCVNGDHWMGMSEVLVLDLWPVVVWCLLCPASANIATLSLLPGHQYPAAAFLIKATTGEYL